MKTWRFFFALALTPLLFACSDEKMGYFDGGEDPLYPDQWHLYNTGQVDGVVGKDINVEPVWAQGIKGESSVIAIVDDSVQIRHPDLYPNVLTAYGWDYVRRNNDPSPNNGSMYHGTMVAGLAAARDLNDEGARGVAPRADLVGFALFAEGSVQLNDAVDAMTRYLGVVDVSNNSWGFGLDGNGMLWPADAAWDAAIKYGVDYGRRGKGLVYVWAAGNGGVDEVDNANFDDQSNGPYVIPVCAVDEKGRRAYYSEQGANLWVCAPGGAYSNSAEGYSLVTTDLTRAAGQNLGNGRSAYDYLSPNYTRFFVGTSGATPIISGVVALMLDANPALTWRDVKLILAESAIISADDDSPAWTQTNPAPGQPSYHVNHYYGFGMVDAAAAVELAKTWESVGNSSMLLTKEADSGFLGSVDLDVEWPLNLPNTQVGEYDLVVSDELIIEYVEVTFDASAADMGHIRITLIAPPVPGANATQSVLAHGSECNVGERVSDIGCDVGYADGWTFGSSRHLGESSLGTWQLRVENNSGGDVGIDSWGLKFYGR